MSSNDAEVRLGAQTGELTSGAKDAAASLATSLQRMQDDLRKLTESSKRNSDEVKRHNKELELSFTALKDKLGGAFSGIAAHIEKIKSVAGVLTGAVAGGLLWKEAVDAAKNLAHEVSTLERVMGFGGQQAQQYAIALKIAGSNADDFANMVMHTGRQLKVNSDEFKRLGITVTDAAGKFLPMDQVLKNSLDTLYQYKPGIDQDMVALTAFGRSAKDAIEILENLERAKARAAQMQKQFGFSDEELHRIKEYKLEAGALSEMLSLIGARIGMTVMPNLMKMAQYFGEVGPAAADKIMTAVKGIITTIDFLAATAKTVYIIFANAFNNMATVARSTWEAITSLSLDPLKKANAQIVANNKATADEVRRVWNETRGRIANLWDESPATSTPGVKVRPRGTRTYTPPPKADTSGPDEQLAIWKEQLHDAQMAEGFFHEMSKAEEADFWRAKLDLIRGGTDKERALRREVNNLLFEADKAFARDQVETYAATQRRMIEEAKNDKTQQMALADQLVAYMEKTYTQDSKQYEAALTYRAHLANEWVHKEQEIGLARLKAQSAAIADGVKLDQMAVDQGVAMRRISAERKFAIERDLANKLYENERAVAEKYRDGLDSRTKEWIDANAAIEKLDREHQATLTKIDNDAELERAQYAIAAAQSVEDSFSTALADAMTGAKSLKAAMLDLFKSIERELANLASKNLAKALFGEGTGGGNALMQLFGMFAPGADAGASYGFTGISTLAKSITPYASGTPYVPRDMVALVHQGERIVPAAQNRPGFGGAVHVTNTFLMSNPTDSRTQDQIAAAAARGVRRATMRNL